MAVTKSSFIKKRRFLSLKAAAKKTCNSSITWQWNVKTFTYVNKFKMTVVVKEELHIVIEGCMIVER